MASKRLRLLVFSIVAVVPVSAATWFGLLTSAESRFFAAKVTELHRLINPPDSSEAPVLSGVFTFDAVSGIPEEFEGQTLGVKYRWPDQLRLRAEVDGNTYALSREGETIRILVPHKKFAIEGANDVPRFSNRPDRVEPVELPAFELPVTRSQLRLLPALVNVEKSMDGEGNLVLRSTPKPFVVKRAGLAYTPHLTLIFDGDGGDPAGIRVEGGNEVDVTLNVSDWNVNREGGLPGLFDGEDIPQPERVALSHLKKFVEVTLANLDSRAEPLPPVTGERRVVARSGAGRLEIHDGTRVLFLKGSPEEMGKQHGELLRDEVREVTDRILYGIGVGSSFSKGRWFFGEIEEAVTRLHPHTDPRYLREMDALAMASGLEIEEARLSNFFPELFHCSGFALHGKATMRGKMYHGRILDYMKGVGLEQNAVVMIVQPDEGNAWVNVGYAGFLGSVTAMNEKHVAIGEMGGRGEGNWDGKAMAQLMREVMEKADTIDEAVAIMEAGPRTCEYYYVISDAKDGRAVGIAATPDTFETIWSGESHPKLQHPIEDTVLMSAGDRYEELVRRVRAGYGKFGPDEARELMSRPVCMKSNIQSVLFAPGSLDFWVANADSENVASHTRYTKYNLGELLNEGDRLTLAGE